VVNVGVCEGASPYVWRRVEGRSTCLLFATSFLLNMAVRRRLTPALAESRRPDESLRGLELPALCPPRRDALAGDRWCPSPCLRGEGARRRIRGSVNFKTSALSLTLSLKRKEDANPAVRTLDRVS
jgi:hypothetical protein